MRKLRKRFSRPGLCTFEPEPLSNRLLEPVILPRWLLVRALIVAGVAVVAQNILLLRRALGWDFTCGRNADTERVDGGAINDHLLTGPALTSSPSPLAEAGGVISTSILARGTSGPAAAVNPAISLSGGQEERSNTRDKSEDGEEDEDGTDPRARPAPDVDLPRHPTANLAAASTGGAEMKQRPLDYRGETSIALLRPESLRLLGPEKPMSTDICVGMSSIRRKDDYVVRTLRSLFSTIGNTSTNVVVHLADFDEEWVREMVHAFQTAPADGLSGKHLHVIHAPKSLYPDLGSCSPRCLGDYDPATARWQSKLNVDYAILFKYASALSSKHYLQLEDDLSFTPGWLPSVSGFISKQPNLSKESNAPWRILDLTGVGCMGKLVQVDELDRLAQYFMMFYDQLPCPSLLVHWSRAMTQGGVSRSDDHMDLFKHIGVTGSHNRTTPVEVNCGAHKAPTCSECLRGKKPQKGWCNGDCVWIGDACMWRFPPPSTQEVALRKTAASLPLKGHDDHSKGTANTRAKPSTTAHPHPFGHTPSLAAGDSVSRSKSNPPGRIMSDMTVIPTFEAHYAYWPGGEQNHREEPCDRKLSTGTVIKHASSQKCWFWAKHVTAGQHFTLIFDKASSLSAIVVQFGQPSYQKDILRNGELQVAGVGSPVVDARASNDPAHACGHFLTMKHIEGESTVAWTLGDPSNSGLPVDRAKCLRVVASDSQSEWMIVSRVHVQTL